MYNMAVFEVNNFENGAHFASLSFHGRDSNSFHLISFHVMYAVRTNSCFPIFNYTRVTYVYVKRVNYSL